MRLSMRIPMLAAALMTTALVPLLSPAALPVASAAGWEGAGSYKVRSTVQDIHLREHPNGVSLGQMGPGTEIQVVSRPDSKGYVWARVRSSTNGTSGTSDDYGVNICAYVRWSGANGSYFYKKSSEHGAFDSTCNKSAARVYAPDGTGPRVPASRYAQWRRSARDLDSRTDHGWDGYWYSSSDGSDGIKVRHGSCPSYRARDYVYGGYRFPAESVVAGEWMTIRYVTSDGTAAMVHLAGGRWRFIPIGCITDSRI